MEKSNVPTHNYPHHHMRTHTEPKYAKHRRSAGGGNPIDTLLHRLGCRPERLERVEGTPLEWTNMQNKPNGKIGKMTNDLLRRIGGRETCLPQCLDAWLPWPLSLPQNKPNRHPSTSTWVSSRASGTSRGSSPRCPGRFPGKHRRSRSVAKPSQCLKPAKHHNSCSLPPNTIRLRIIARRGRTAAGSDTTGCGYAPHAGPLRTFEKGIRHVDSCENTCCGRDGG